GHPQPGRAVVSGQHRCTSGPGPAACAAAGKPAIRRTSGMDPADTDVLRLRITEVFLSLQGEARDAGWPTVFVRLTGCPLRCTYCDTSYGFHGGEWRSIDSLVAQARAFGVRHVCVTGGEPLAQKRCLVLLERLC